MVRHKHEIDLSVLTKFAARLIVVHTISFTSLIRFFFFFCFVFGVFFLSQCVVVFCLRVVYFSSPMFTLNLTRYWKFMHFITILFVAHFYVYLNCCVLDFSFCFCFFFLDNVQWNFLIVLNFAENICRMIVCNESRISGPESESECFRTRSVVHTHNAQFLPLILHEALLVCFFLSI